MSLVPWGCLRTSSLLNRHGLLSWPIISSHYNVVHNRNLGEGGDMLYTAITSTHEANMPHVYHHKHKWGKYASCIPSQAHMRQICHMCNITSSHEANMPHVCHHKHTWGIYASRMSPTSTRCAPQVCQIWLKWVVLALVPGPRRYKDGDVCNMPHEVYSAVSMTPL
jgi:hypothetical protein